MKNLAGDKNADDLVKEELYIAGIPTINCEGNGEVFYKHIGRIGNWTFKRAWSYWIASVPDGEKGLPLKIAMDLYNLKHPTNDNEIMGNIIRTGGHCGCPSPDEFGAEPIHDNEGKLTVERYVDCYHIDNLIGLKILAEVIKNNPQN